MNDSCFHLSLLENCTATDGIQEICKANKLTLTKHAIYAVLLHETNTAVRLLRRGRHRQCCT